MYNVILNSYIIFQYINDLYDWNIFKRHLKPGDRFSNLVLNLVLQILKLSLKLKTHWKYTKCNKETESSDFRAFLIEIVTSMENHSNENWNRIAISTHRGHSTMLFAVSINQMIRWSPSKQNQHRRLWNAFYI